MFDIYRVRPSHVEAVQLTNDNAENIAKEFGGKVFAGVLPSAPSKVLLWINGRQGFIREGEVLVRSRTGELSIETNPDLFHRKYEKAPGYVKHVRN